MCDYSTPIQDQNANLRCLQYIKYVLSSMHQIRVYKAFIDRQVEVNVISQYNAQCSELRRRLEEEGFANYKVNTVVSSQGNPMFPQLS